MSARGPNRSVAITSGIGLVLDRTGSAGSRRSVDIGSMQVEPPHERDGDRPLCALMQAHRGPIDCFGGFA